MCIGGGNHDCLRTWLGHATAEEIDRFVARFIVPGAPSLLELGFVNRLVEVGDWSDTDSEIETGIDLRVGLDDSLSLDADGANGVRHGTRQILQDLKLEDAVKLEWK